METCIILFILPLTVLRFFEVHCVRRLAPLLGRRSLDRPRGSAVTRVSTQHALVPARGLMWVYIFVSDVFLNFFMFFMLNHVTKLSPYCTVTAATWRSGPGQPIRTALWSWEEPEWENPSAGSSLPTPPRFLSGTCCENFNFLKLWALERWRTESEPSTRCSRLDPPPRRRLWAFQSDHELYVGTFLCTSSEFSCTCGHFWPEPYYLPPVYPPEGPAHCGCPPTLHMKLRWPKTFRTKCSVCGCWYRVLTLLENLEFLKLIAENGKLARVVLETDDIIQHHYMMSSCFSFQCLILSCLS